MKRIRTVRDLRGEVYNLIKAGITNRTFPPGTQLREADLVRDLGVSRTPIREAFNQLSKEGMVEIIPRRGAFVKLWTKEEVVEILVIREVLEGLAARLATRRLDSQAIDNLEGCIKGYVDGEIEEYSQADRLFHEGIINACGMDRLINLLQNLYDSLQMSDVLSMTFQFPGRIEESMAEHQKIIEAFKKHDEDLAEKVAREHFQHAKYYYQRLPR